MPIYNKRTFIFFLALYYQKRAEAIARPDDKMSCIIDGMDQAKLNLPLIVEAVEHSNGSNPSTLPVVNFLEIYECPMDT